MVTHEPRWLAYARKSLHMADGKLVSTVEALR